MLLPVILLYLVYSLYVIIQTDEDSWRDFLRILKFPTRAECEGSRFILLIS
jgi:hypothetical protein